MKFWTRTFLILLALATVGLGQQVDQQPSRTLGGYLYQTALTPEWYVITNEQELKPFTTMLPPTTPYKNLPAPPNPDPFLHGFTVDFEQQVLVVAVGRNRIKNAPVYQGVKAQEDGRREVSFTLPAPTTEAYPYGWAVYTAIVLPRIEAETRVVVTTLPVEPQPWIKDAKFPRL